MAAANSAGIGVFSPAIRADTQPSECELHGGPKSYAFVDRVNKHLIKLGAPTHPHTHPQCHTTGWLHDLDIQTPKQKCL